jgi:hypothetical protein
VVADFKGAFKLGNGRYYYPHTVTDRAARFLLLCEAPRHHPRGRLRGGTSRLTRRSKITAGDARIGPVARSQHYYLDITHPLANKGDALSEIARLLAVPLTETAVIGDGANDLAMFERSGLSIAMGNASPELQRSADFTTDSNADEGFANAVERFILPRLVESGNPPRAGGAA